MPLAAPPLFLACCARMVILTAIIRPLNTLHKPTEQEF
jgi:hypothetical protein